jgi:hypothetical protein
MTDEWGQANGWPRLTMFQVPSLNRPKFISNVEQNEIGVRTTTNWNVTFSNPFVSVISLQGAK